MNDLQTTYEKLVRAAKAMAELLEGSALAVAPKKAVTPRKAKTAPKKRRAYAHKGRKYAPGTHWTQKPGGRERLSAIMRDTFAKPPIETTTQTGESAQL
jgi:hypothetical protein